MGICEKYLTLPKIPIYIMIITAAFKKVNPRREGL